ncbi:MAG: hypothetical protein ABJC12_00920 [Saprospiraceae bacterium]
MYHSKAGIPVFLFFISLLFSTSLLHSQQLNLKVAGDSIAGFHIDLYDGPQKLVTQTEEFSLQLYNTDLSTTANLPQWTGQTWSGNADSITLQRVSYINEFDANLTIKVIYHVVNAHVIKKTIELFQPCMPDMLYMLEQSAKPVAIPKRYITFEYDSFPGGFVHEMFPAAGFITPENTVVGFLTDAGYKNQYTRNTRRRFSGRGGGFVGMRLLPDPELFSVANLEERVNHDDYVKQTFGELYNIDEGEQTLMPLPDQYQRVGNVEVKRENNLITINSHGDKKAGIEFIAPLADQHVYTISFLCKGNTPVALKFFRMKNGQKTIELEDGIKYIDQFPTSNDEWTLFKGSILVPYIEHDAVSMFIGSQSDKTFTLQIKNLQIIEHQPKKEPYNILPIGEKVEKTTYIFAEPWTSHQQFMISSQSLLAEAMGFEGSQIEKMVYANFNMLTWITDVNDFSPFNVPNMNYAPDMYNRDCFFSTIATYNKELNLKLWDQWGKTQTAAGGIGTIITPRMGSVEAKDNEATIEWLIWAMMNKRRFGITLPQAKIKKAVDYVLRELDPDRDGKCTSHFSLSQVDIVDFNPPTDRLGVNQGMLAIALRTIKELGFSISKSYIQKAEQEYRNFYDVGRQHLLFDRNFPDVITLTDLEPEFFSLWLFHRPMLTDEMVQHHLDQIPILNKVPNSPHPEFGTTAPICVRLIKEHPGYAYLSGDYQPFEKFGEENYSDGKSDGYYYNGGSWFRAEYCAYVVGLKHGWTKANKLMDNRIWAEIYLNPKWPFSKEFIPTKWTTTDSWWPSTRGLCWNVFILMADEVAGLRTPEMDPDYKSEK